MDGLRVLVIGTAPAGASDKQLPELVGGGRALAEATGGTLAAAVVGGAGGAAEAAREAGGRGAGTVYLVENPALDEYQADRYLAALAAVCRRVEPDVVLLGAGDAGRELAPRLAHRLGGALVTDCVAVRAEDGGVILTRPVYGGKALAEVLVRRGPCVTTVRPRACDPAPPVEGAGADVVALDVPLDGVAARTRVVERHAEDKAGISLEEARVVVSGGRGMGGPEGFALLEELAGVVGAALGASRAAVDAGWAPAAWQVGQTGKIVAPDLYVAVGISGASQHLAGIAAARHVVAVNKDPEAPIFKRAEVGVAADYRQVLPALTRCLRERLRR